MDLIHLTIDIFKQLRSEGQWELLWKEIEIFAKHHDIEIMSATRQRHPPASLSNYLLTADSIGTNEMLECSSKSYKISMYFPTIDVVLAEMIIL